MNKIGWICVQKAGSTSFRYLIRQYNIDFIHFVGDWEGHAYCFETNNIVGFQWLEKFPSFNKNDYGALYTIVRNPFDILISYYFHYYISPEFVIDNGWHNCNSIHEICSWRDFLSKYTDPNYSWHMPRMKQSLFSFLYDENWNLIIDRYFKLENISEINNYLSSIGVSESLPYLNISNKPENTKYYTSQDVKRLNNIWKKDLDYFGYEYTGQ